MEEVAENPAVYLIAVWSGVGFEVWTAPIAVWSGILPAPNSVWSVWTAPKAAGGVWTAPKAVGSGVWPALYKYVSGVGVGVWPALNDYGSPGVSPKLYITSLGFENVPKDPELLYSA